MALNDTCWDSTYVIANMRTWRREAYLGCLRPSTLQEALQSSKSNADRMLHEATLSALAQPRPAPGTPLVKCGPRSFTTTAVRPSAASAQRLLVFAHARDSQGGSCGLSTPQVGGVAQDRGRDVDSRHSEGRLQDSLLCHPQHSQPTSRNPEDMP
ncbi:hypothetical protein E2C01_046359 [Portunus trituberculatus]|uniref:Uncharacterized protein n=1 Tax=Portunus trituberculatus TaxID=210409 RepID=A0A5B7G4J4_PORTR|nr:hypothetical protein [Portunus trituberculatus]